MGAATMSPQSSTKDLPESCTSNVRSSPSGSTKKSKNRSARNDKTVQVPIVTSKGVQPPIEDFVLFSEEPHLKKHPNKSRTRSQRSGRNSSSHSLPLSKRPTCYTAQRPEQETLTPMQRRAIRHQRALESTAILEEENQSRRGLEIPPAPMPPRLDTPDLDDIDGDSWSCCTFNESDAEAYIAATNLRCEDKMPLLSLSVREDCETSTEQRPAADKASPRAPSKSRKKSRDDDDT